MEWTIRVDISNVRSCRVDGKSFAKMKCIGVMRATLRREEYSRCKETSFVFNVYALAFNPYTDPIVLISHRHPAAEASFSTEL